MTAMHWYTIDGNDVGYTGKWGPDHPFMDDSLPIRIKPEKVKRWIIWHVEHDRYHSHFEYDPRGSYQASFKYSVHEIEVEAIRHD